LRCGHIKSGCEKGKSLKDAVLGNVSFKNVFVNEVVFDGAIMGFSQAYPVLMFG
jgi:hypothetical protein